MKISTLFIIDAVELNETEREYFQSLFAEWEILTTVNGRYLVDALIDENNYSAAETALASRNVYTVGKWDINGDILFLATDLTEYISLLPADKSMDANNNVILTPKTTAVEVHAFAGWGAKKWA